MGEIKSHTALRGIAALLVVIFHYRAILAPTINIDDYTSFFAKGYLWVDCFFMLSGFILCHVYGTRPGHTRRESSEFFIARIARIYPLHLATLFSLAAMSLVLPKISHQHFDPNWSTFFLNLIGIHAWGFLSAYDWNFPSWSISVEFASYLIFPLICIGLDRATRTTLLIMGLSFCFSLWLGHENWERLALWHGLPMFFAGIILFHIPKIPSPWMQLVAAGGLVLSMHLGLADAVSTLCFAALIYSIQSDSGPVRSLLWQPLLSLGTWSYSIYMLHIPIWYFANSIFGLRLTPVEMFVFCLSATIAAGAASFHSFEDPVRRLIRTSGRPNVELRTVVSG